MAFLDETFVADDLPQSDRSYDLLPEGWYDATISKAEVGNTKAGTGTKIDVRYDITGPTHQGRVVFGNLNIRNPNPKAEEIGRQQLGDLLRSIGIAKVSDTDQLIGNRCSIKLVTKTSEGYEPSNEIKGWKAIEGASIPKPAASPSAPATAPSSPPWAKK